MRTRCAAAILVIAALTACGGRSPRILDAAACPADAKPANLDLRSRTSAGKTCGWPTTKVRCCCSISGRRGADVQDRDSRLHRVVRQSKSGLRVVSVVLLDKFENAKPFAATMKMNYPVLDGDPQQDKIDDAYGPLFGLPMSFVISRDGRICQKHLGLPGATATTSPDEKSVKDVFEKQIKALL